MRWPPFKARGHVQPDAALDTGVKSAPPPMPGSTVRCIGGEAGVVADLLIDADSSRVTHLLVESPQNHPARVVPIELAARGVVRGPAAGRGRSIVMLRCTSWELHRLPTAA
jgi:hypothetical protein